jgi:shikimate dehydrogenase
LQLLRERAVNPDQSVLVRGSGGMAKAVVAAFKQAGFDRLTILARNQVAGAALADKYGFTNIDETQLESSSEKFDVIVNVTPIGMAGQDENELSFSEIGDHRRRSHCPSGCPPIRRLHRGAVNP